VRFIEKLAEPPLLRKWKWDNSRLPENLSYANIPADALAELRETLLKEQGCLCGYTMMRIASSDGGHIEHLHPRSRPPRESGVAYANMIYCFPGAGAEGCEFGAHRKDDFDVTNDNFVSPLQRSCETRLTYDLSGKVGAKSPTDSAARQTIATLNLNHGELVALRTAAIRSQRVFRRAPKPLAASEARKLAARIMERDGTGKIAPFCVAIKQVAERFAEQREARSAGIARKSAP
jgi:uncharacterized protein (TIGR02646 family)